MRFIGEKEINYVIKSKQSKAWPRMARHGLDGHGMDMHGKARQHFYTKEIHYVVS